ncbi:hypothetical protein PC117_g1146 [Phytophthora cactorum]|uniref:SWIM-type domain-containing protein n=1 Tax=Phytophthora cactorum TaxID=29920 RepID=A0A8T1ES90_9STRA|nr:hypothetical protein PC117_g1146 [Phytophthora cactorum]
MNWNWSHEKEGSGDSYAKAMSEGNRARVTWPRIGEVTCDCTFYVSMRLPYQHLCSVLVTCVTQHRFEVEQRHPRWSMKEAKIVLPNVESTVKHLRKVSRAIGESKNAAAVHVRLTANSRIAYVKLKKGEVSEHTVFVDLRATLEVFKKKWSLEGSAQRDGGGDIESDGGLDHLEVEEDVIEVAEVEQLQPGSFERRGSSNVVPTDTLQCIAQEGTSDDLHLDINDDLDDCCVKNPTQVSMPDLDMSEQSQELLQRTFTTETGSRTDTDLVEFARRRDTNNDYEKERKGGFSVNSV